MCFMLTALNIFRVDFDVLVSVRSALFMPYTKSVHDLVHDGSFTQATISKCDLGFASVVTNWGVASECMNAASAFLDEIWR